MDAEMNRKLSVVSPEEAETDIVKQEYGERMKKENGFENFKGNDPLAMTSFPVPVSPVISTGKSVRAIR